jgi:transcriptional regulator with XRE-family HTH domain
VGRVSAPPPSAAALGRAIRQLRHDRGLSIEALADLAGMHPTYLSGIERGLQNPSYSKLASLAVALDVGLSDLMLAAEGRRRR